MPNWVENKLIISGDSDRLTALENQLKAPYTREVEDWSTHEVEEEVVDDQVFQLWNIIKPTNLDAYYGREDRVLRQAEQIIRKAQQEMLTPEQIKENSERVVEQLKEALTNFTPISFDFEAAMREVKDEIATKDDWYNWNVRNWGTKWEISDAGVSYNELGNLVYGFQTAWAPPVEAIDNLAEQYPDLTFTMYGIDEGDCFAYSIGWENGEREFENDLDITHDLKEEMYGECPACGWLLDEDDEDNQEYRKELGCPDPEEGEE